jgi:hypothetical protein
MSKHVVVTMRYSQARAAGPPSNEARPFHARSSASCTASSACSMLPSIR